MKSMPGVRQVAELAGVSRGTVSNALNHPHRLDAETLRRVLEAVETLGYVPNDAARTLSTGTSTIAGLILPGLHTSVFVNMARNAQVAAHRIGLNLLIADSEAVAARQLEHLRYFQASRARGILIVPSDDAPSTIDAINAVAAQGQNLIAVNFVSDRLDVPSVVTDEHRSGMVAAELALSRPVRSVVWVEGDLSYQPVGRRRHGVLSYLKGRGASHLFDTVDAGGLNVSNGMAIARTVLDTIGARRPASIIAVSTPLAVGILRQFQALGVSVPDEVEIIACEEDTEVLVPGDQVIAVGADGRALGDEAVALLGELALDQGRGGIHRSIVIPPKVVRPQDRLVPAIMT